MRVILLVVVMLAVLHGTNADDWRKKFRRYYYRPRPNTHSRSSSSVSSKDLATIRATLAAVQKDVHSLKKETSSLTDGLASTNAIVAQLRDEVKDLLGNSGIDDLRREVEGLKNILRNLQSDVNDLSGLESRVDRLEYQIDQLASSGVDASVIADLRRADDELNNRLRGVISQVNTHENRLDSLDRRVNINTNDIQILKNSNGPDDDMETVTFSGTVELTAANPTVTITYAPGFNFDGKAPTLHWSIIGFRSGPAFDEFPGGSTGSSGTGSGSGTGGSPGPQPGPDDSYYTPPNGQPSTYNGGNFYGPSYPPAPGYAPPPPPVSLPTMYVHVDGRPTTSGATFTLGDHSSLGWEFDVVVVRWIAIGEVDDERAGYYN